MENNSNVVTEVATTLKCKSCKHGNVMKSQNMFIKRKITLPLLFTGSCSQTQTQDNPWWRVDLGYTTAIRELFIVGPHNGTALKDFEVRIGDSIENQGNENDKCGDKYSVKPKEIKTITCNLTGRYINIRIPESTRNVHLCEVVPYGMGKLTFSLSSAVFPSDLLSNPHVHSAESESSETNSSC